MPDDTAEPHEPAMADKPDTPPEEHPSNLWPLLLVLLAVGVGVVYAYFGFWRRAAMCVAGAMALGGVMRLFFSRQTAGLLIVRRRFVDVSIYFFLGIAIMVVAFVVPPAR